MTKFAKMMRTAKHHKRMRFLKAEMRFLRGALEMMCCCESAETLERLRTADMEIRLRARFGHRARLLFL